MQSVVQPRLSAFEIDVDRTPLGATYTGSFVTFLVWAPNARAVDIHVVSPVDRVIRAERAGDGYYFAADLELKPGARYFYRLNGGAERPDPASRSQPDGVHGPSEVIESPAPVESWRAPALRDYVIYELHTGTFTREGTFDAAIRELDRLRGLGITVIELMPIAEFPGARNWGYDGVFPFAAARCYGGRPALARLVHACHERGIAVALDVVYNHLGPEGNYLAEFGPYFTPRYHTPWGNAVNFDGPESDHVRRFFLENALYWVRDCGIDCLRLDAVHAVIDRSASPFLQELAGAVHAYARESGRNVYVVAESDLNDSRLIRPVDEGGYGLDAQWSDDFHHCLHTLLTGEHSGYYADFGAIEQFAAALKHGWTYSGQYSPFRRRRFGNSPSGLSPQQFIVCSQNHDQVGNRMNGERLLHLVDWERAKLAAAAVLLSPFTPFLFMGEEYAEPAPFLYHISHSDPELQRAVREGRKAEFREFHVDGEPPDPQSEETFARSKLHSNLAREGRHARMHAYYCELIRIRNLLSPMRPQRVSELIVETRAPERVVQFEAGNHHGAYRVILNFDSEPHAIENPGAGWRRLLDSSDPQWSESAAGHYSNSGFQAQPHSCIVLARLENSPEDQR